jgi:hypothetical protein
MQTHGTHRVRAGVSGSLEYRNRALTRFSNPALPDVTIQPPKAPVKSIVVPKADTTGKAERLVAESMKHCYNSGCSSSVYTSWFGGSPEPSAAFAAYIAAKAGLSTEVGRASTPAAWADWYKAQGRWGLTPVVGALTFYDKDDDGRPADSIDYVGICRKPNTTSQRSSTGAAGCENTEWDRNDVRGRHRVNQVIGYGYPAYIPVS